MRVRRIRDVAWLDFERNNLSRMNVRCAECRAYDPQVGELARRSATCGTYQRHLSQEPVRGDNFRSERDRMGSSCWLSCWLVKDIQIKQASGTRRKRVVDAREMN